MTRTLIQLLSLMDNAENGQQFKVDVEVQKQVLDSQAKARLQTEIILLKFGISSLINLGKPGCSFYRTCNECQSDPECGWCDDGSGTGLGKCLPGGNNGNYDISEIEANDVLTHFGLISQIQGLLYMTVLI